MPRLPPIPPPKEGGHCRSTLPSPPKQKVPSFRSNFCTVLPSCQSRVALPVSADPCQHGAFEGWPTSKGLQIGTNHRLQVLSETDENLMETVETPSNTT